MKNWFHEIRKGYLGGLGAVLLAWTLAAIPAVPRLVLGLALTDMQVLYIRAGLALFGFAILSVVGWLLFVQTSRKLKAVERDLIGVRNQLAQAPTRPHRFQDDCTVDDATGLYRHKTKQGFFCVACAAENDRESPMKTEKDGWGWSCPVKSEHFVQGPNWRMPEIGVQRSPWRLGPEDF